MLPDPSLLVEDITARFFVFAEIVIKDGAQCRSAGVACRARDMTLDILRESYGCQESPEPAGYTGD